MKKTIQNTKNKTQKSGLTLQKNKIKKENIPNRGDFGLTGDSCSAGFSASLFLVAIVVVVVDQLVVVDQTQVDYVERSVGCCWKVVMMKHKLTCWQFSFFPTLSFLWKL